jgi:hypothetical protein
MADRKPTKEQIDTRVAVAKARLAAMADDMAARPGPASQVTNRVATVVRGHPWRGVGIALGLGLALGLTRGRALGVVAGTVVPLVGTVGKKVVSSGVLQKVGAAVPQAASRLAAKASEVRSRTADH